MTALIVIGSILAFFLLLLLAPASVAVRYSGGEVRVKACYLFLRFDLLKKRPKKEKKPAPEKEKEKEPEPEKEPKKKENLIKTAWELLKASKRGLSIFRRHLVFSRVRIALKIGGEDAHQIAVSYAKIAEAVTAALDVIALTFVLRKPKVSVAPDFSATAVEAEVSLRVGIRPLFAIMAGLSILRRYLGRRGRKKKRRSPRVPQAASAGNAHPKAM